MKNGGGREKFSLFNLSHNFSIDLRLGTRYECNVIKASTTIIKKPIFSYVVCQLSSTPADQRHVTSVRGVTNHCLTHVCIISPILQKIVI